MRSVLTGLSTVLVATVAGTSSLPNPAAAQIVVESREDAEARQRAEIKFGFCETSYENPDLASGVVELPFAAFLPGGLFHDGFRDFARSNHIYCWTTRTFREAEARFKDRLEQESRMVASNWTGQWPAASSSTESRPSTVSHQQADGRPQTDQERASAKAQADAEWNRKVAEHQAALARYNAQVAATEAEKARQAAQHDRNAEAAQRALREHEAQVRAQREQYQRQLQEHAKRVEEMYPDSPCARFRRAKGEGWTVNPCV